MHSEHEHGACCCEHGHHHDKHNGNDHSEHEHIHGAAASVSEHDGAVIGSFTWEFEGIYDRCIAEAQSRMTAIAEKTEAAGGMIGHIKAFAEEIGRGCMLSVTDSSACTAKKTELNKTRVSGAAIVFGVEAEKMKQWLEEWTEL